MRFVRSCLNDKRDTTPHTTGNLYVANFFRPDVVDFSTRYLQPDPAYTYRSTITAKNGGWNGEQPRVYLIYREILRLRHRETIYSGTTVTFQTRTAIVSVSRYRAGDESLFLLSICATTNKRTNQRTDEETKFQFWRVCACSLARDDVRARCRDPRCTTYALACIDYTHIPMSQPDC